jgi:hypothetical protein
MEYTKTGSETHQQEHRFEFPPEPLVPGGHSQNAARAQGFASPRLGAPLPTARRSAVNQSRDERLRRELKSPALWNIRKRRASSPLWF